MKTTALKQTIQKGFTLVELLVVIAILGVLAAVLLATLDPVEQINKSKDSASLQVAREYAGAVQRYYASHTLWPWSATATTPCNTSTTPSAMAITSSDGCTTNLKNDGELKASFAVPAGTTMVLNGGADTVTVCYLPISKSGKKDPNNKYTNAGAATCNPATTACYTCISQ